MREKTLLMLLMSLLACSIAAGSSLPPPVLNPTTYTSPSGGYSLFVNPSDLHGAGPADYRFTKSNEVLWAKQLPFTLWEAVVTDSGQIAGYGYTHGPDGFSEAGYAAGMGEFIVATLSAAGDVVKQDVHAREHSNFPDFYPNPRGRGIALDGFSERFIVRVADPDLTRGIEQWWVYDLRSGERTHTLEPELELAADGRYHSIFEARAVPGTPLTLVHWWCYTKRRGRPGAVFTLVDGKGRQLWSLHRKGDYAALFSRYREDKIRRLIGENGAIPDVREDGTFDLHFVKENLRASFAVSERAPGDWVVKKFGEERYAWPDPPPTPSPPSFPALRLRQVGEARLSRKSTGGASRVSDTALSAPGHVYVGPDDRLYVADRRTRAVHVFDSSGERLGQCIPRAEDLTEFSDVRHVALSNDGHVFALLSYNDPQSLFSGTRYLEFDGELTRQGWASVDADPITQWYFQPATDLCWIVGYNDIFLVRNLRHTVRRISRRADGRWLEYPGDAAVAPDGSLAVLTHSQGWDASVTILSPTGDAQSTFDIPDELWWCSLAYDGRHVFVRGKRKVYVYQTDGRAVGQLRVPSGFPAAQWSGSDLAAKGNEIWFFDRNAMKLRRYAVPDGLARPGEKTACIDTAHRTARP